MIPTKRILLGCPIVVAALLSTAPAADPSLIVVQDLGGVPSKAYYSAINVKRGNVDRRTQSAATAPPPPSLSYSEADLLPVRSMRLTLGRVERCELRVPRLRPIFLIGDDDQSRRWLLHRLDSLRALHAVGLVVNVETLSGLNSLRSLAPGLILAPASADDLAVRLHLSHYPVLITATAIEQ